MGTGLFLGILGTVIYGMLRGPGNVDMTGAYRHIAIPVAFLSAPSR